MRRAAGRRDKGGQGKCSAVRHAAEDARAKGAADAVNVEKDEPREEASQDEPPEDANVEGAAGSLGIVGAEIEADANLRG